MKKSSLRLAIAGSLGMHLIFISSLQWVPQSQPNQVSANTKAPALPPLIMTVLPQPVKSSASAATSEAVPEALAPRPFTVEATPQLATPIEATTLQAPAAKEAENLPTVSPEPVPAPLNQTVEAVPAEVQPLNLALPKGPSGSAAPGPFNATGAQDSPRSLGERIRSRIDAERQKQRVPVFVDPYATQIEERVNADGSRHAKIQTPWGSFCLNGPRPGAPRDARMPTNTVVPRTCP